MTARAFLIRGLIAGLVAGVVTFVVAFFFGEPSVDSAIGVEIAGAGAEPASEDGGHDHSHGGEAEVPRGTQKTWGLLTAMILVGPALGGIVALVAASVVGRVGRLTPSQSTALVAVLGFISVSLAPFLKYPGTPPAVGNEDTIGSRTGYFFLFMLISVLAMAAAVALGRHLLKSLRPLEAVVIAAAAYLVVVVAIGHLMPTVNEIGDFPGDVLWHFRRASLITLTTMWAVTGVVLTALVGRLHERQSSEAARRDLAASL